MSKETELLSARWPLPFVWVADRRFNDGLAVSILIGLATLYTFAVVRPVHAFVRGDWPAQFFPVYSYLGERLRALDIPAWNPHQFAGASFAGDPESGWMYVPAMVIYAIFPAEAATAVYIGLHIAFAGVAIYALARLLGLGVSGSLIGGASYAFGWVAPGSMHLTIFFPVTLWLIVALIAVELAARTNSWPGRLRSWLLAAFAMSQILAIWLGQASYYAMLAIAAWIAYRMLLVPEHSSPLRARIVPFISTGLVVFALAFGLAAAGLLPRLETVAHSNLAGGVYDVASSWEDAQTGFSPPELLYEIAGGYTGSLWWYTGAVAMTLALMAPVIAWRWRGMAYCVFLAAMSLILALAEPTPVHGILYTILPRFAGLHEHSPERVLLLFGPAVALLAAATITYLPRWPHSRAVLTVIALVPAGLVLAVARSAIGDGDILSRESALLAIAASLLAACVAAGASTRFGRTALLGLVLLVLWDPAGRVISHGLVDETNLERSLRGSLAADVEPFLYANGAAEFIARQTAIDPGRYAGFDPALLPDPASIEIASPDIGYRGWGSLKNPIVNRLLVFNWATWFGIDDIQGYNPIQIKRYVEYIDAMNGHRQEYHERDLFPAGLSSPLLDLLNLRYLIVPVDAANRPDLAPLIADFPSVYEDENVRILENPNAFPRAWLVHEARQVAPGGALPLLADGTVDPRQTVLLEAPPPVLQPLPDGAVEDARYIRNEPDRIEVAVSAGVPALLVLSEIWDPGWQATVDGTPAPVLLANHVLRAVPVPAGEHIVILSYDPLPLKLGLLVTLATFILAIAAAAWATMREHGRRARETNSS